MTVTTVPLGHGVFALIDAEDAERVLCKRWHAQRWTTKSAVYAQHSRKLDGRNSPISLHRFVIGAGPGQVVDHINGDTLDNRKANLRVTDARGNSRNVTRSKNQKLGGYKGVHWHKAAGKWEAYICAGPPRTSGGRTRCSRIYLGLFTDPADAARAYDAAALQHFGEFAALNFPAKCAAALLGEAANG